MDLIALISLSCSFMVMRRRLWPCEVIVLFPLHRNHYTLLSRDGRCFVFWALSHQLSLFFLNTIAPLLSPSMATISSRELQVSFPCQVLQPAMLSILLSYLKNVEYQQWLSLVHCQLLYEAILAEWDGSQSRESSAAVCTTTPVTAGLSCSLYSPAALGAAVVVDSRLNGHGQSLGRGCQRYLPAPAPAHSQLLKVCLTEGLGCCSSLGTSQTLVSVLNFLTRVGGG